MQLHPLKFIKMSACLLPLASACTLPFQGSWFAAGVLLSGMFLALNLYLWIRMIALVLAHVSQGVNPKGLQLFLMMKIIVLATCIFIGTLIFPVMSIILGNSIVVLSVLLPSFYASFTSSYTSLPAGASQ